MIQAKDILAMVEREGGFVNNPADKGGPTKYGITQATLSAYRGYAVYVAEVAALKIEEACEIYLQRFVMAPGINEIAFKPLELLLFDCCVQFGKGDNGEPWEGIVWLQEAMNGSPSSSVAKPVNVDGRLGPQTYAALYGLSNESKMRLCLKIAALRLEKRRRVVRKDASQRQFLDGWLLRDAEVLRSIA